MKRLVDFSKNNKGMTMTEVIVGFVVLMLFMGSLSGIIAFSSNMLMNSQDIAKNREILEAELYKKSTSENASGYNVSMQPLDDAGSNAGPAFVLDNIQSFSVDSDDISGVDSEFDIIVYGFKNK